MDFTMAASVDMSELSQWYEKSVVGNYRLFFSIAYQILLDTHEAEEAAQDAVLKGWSHLGELHDPSSLVGWIARITRTTALDRKKKRAPELVDDTVLDGMPPNNHALPEPDRRDERAALLREIGQLPESQAVVITLRFFDGLDVHQIANRLGILENAVRVRLHRGMENLRQRPRLREMSGADQ
jgi:RNA polymerase sigma-70 factor (ECF subfamily)